MNYRKEILKINYERVKALHRAFCACEADFKQSKIDAETLARAIEEKLRMDRGEQEEKIADYTRQRDDVNQPPTIRRLAALELEKLEALEIRPSPEEVELFRGLLNEQRQCLHDMNGLQRDFRDALKDVEGDLATLRADVLGSHTADMGGQWVDSQEKRFDRLTGGGPNA